MSQCRRRKCAFTLVELLVVIGIIAVLVAILLPALARAKKQASALACASDMRTILQGLQQYALDNRDHLPIVPWIGVRPTAQYAQVAFTFDSDGIANFGEIRPPLNTAYGSLLKYIGSSPAVRAKVMWCPDDDGVSPFDRSIRRNYSYSFNYLINLNGLDPKGDSVKLGRIRNSAQRILIFEEAYPNDGYCVWTLWDADALTPRHNGRCNAAFADGHVARYFPKEIFARSDYCDILK